MLVAVKLSLKDILQRLKELSDDGMYMTDVFDQTHQEYRHALSYSNRTERLEARSYLAGLHAIGNLDIEHMREELECE